MREAPAAIWRSTTSPVWAALGSPLRSCCAARTGRRSRRWRALPATCAVKDGHPHKPSMTKEPPAEAGGSARGSDFQLECAEIRFLHLAAEAAEGPRPQGREATGI